MGTYRRVKWCSRPAMSARTGPEARRGPRYPLRGAVQLSWQLWNGETRTCRGTFVAVSDRGCVLSAASLWRLARTSSCRLSATGRWATQRDRNSRIQVNARLCAIGLHWSGPCRRSTKEIALGCMKFSAHSEREVWARYIERATRGWGERSPLRSCRWRRRLLMRRASGCSRRPAQRQR